MINLLQHSEESVKKLVNYFVKLTRNSKRMEKCRAIRQRLGLFEASNKCIQPFVVLPALHSVLF